jgi:hypothetical protein
VSQQPDGTWVRSLPPVERNECRLALHMAVERTMRDGDITPLLRSPASRRSHGLISRKLGGSPPHGHSFDCLKECHEY